MKINTLNQLRARRDAARSIALYGPRNTAAPCADEFGRWCCAAPGDVAAYRAAVAAVRRALRGTRYETADPEYA